MSEDQNQGFPQPTPSSPSPAAPPPGGTPPPSWSPTPPPPVSGGPGMPPTGPPPGWGQAAPAPGWQPGMMAPTKPSYSGTAIASFVTSLFWVCGLGSLAAVILGILGIRSTKDGARRGRWMAVVGLVLGIIGIISTVAIGIVVATVGESENEDVDIVSCERVGGEAVATVEITNSTSRVSQYIVTITFDPAGDDTSVTGVVTVDDVGPGETVTARVGSGGAVGGTGGLSCSEYVQRFAS